ncbi:Uncharacterised protein [Suttonella ornithocola]|uniref:Uncharacterized protein n=2 Tax=Suttonella ornithocola TaxID=279832 RepID=A0A380MS23_9GAMM|nr:Uncharacterised protein [Suttonella ornithocola]
MVQKTSSSLEPTPKLRRTWQLLGYRRYLPRAQFLTQQSTTRQIVSDSPTEHSTCLVQKADNLSSLSDQQLLTDNKSLSIGYTIGDLQVFDAKTFTAIYAKNTSLAWLFPPLWYRNPHFHLFAAVAEEELFLNALQSVNLVKIAEDFKQVFSHSFEQAPRYAVSKEMSFVKRLSERQWISVGSDNVVKQLIEYGYRFSIQPLKLTHPALLLDNPLEKKTLWIELLALAQRENI